MKIGALIAIPLMALLNACSHFQGGSTAAPPSNGLPSGAIVASTPLGQIAGSPGSVSELSTPNPYEGNTQAVQEGKKLFVKMNCAGCHAYDGSGNMGPDLTDKYWRYGGLPIQIFKSIQDGRPQGMPAWGKALSQDDIWKLVAFVESFGGSVSVSHYNDARQGDEPGEGVAPEAQSQVTPDAGSASKP
jgi:cytochrome c oxidase cbb3-type subunit 3